jgi:hypothetical protein
LDHIWNKVGDGLLVNIVREDEEGGAGFVAGVERGDEVLFGGDVVAYPVEGVDVKVDLWQTSQLWGDIAER